MPRYHQPTGLAFDAANAEDAYAVGDTLLSALNEAATQLDGRAQLHLAPLPARELLLPPRIGLLVSAAQAIAAAADIYDTEPAASVHVELAGSILNVVQADSAESYDLEGKPVEYPPLGDRPPRPAIVLTATELKRAAAEAVAERGAQGAWLSEPLDGEESPPLAE